MRRVSIYALTPEMELARPVCNGTQVLINVGLKHLDRYVGRLEEMGITSLYIEDDAGEGIEVDDLITIRTRMQCKRALKHNFIRMKNNLSINMKETSVIAQDLFDEILGHQDVLYDLNEIGSMGDNTLDHSLNTAIYSICLAIQLKYNTARTVALGTGTLLHDVGKTLLNHKILFKPGKLTKEEFEHIKTHPVRGYELLIKNKSLEEEIGEISLLHHERIDGSGYPYGLRGHEIPEPARICSIVDVYEALTVKRCYHDAIAPVRATEILTQEAANKLDFDLASIFLKNIAIYPTGSTVLLSDGRYAIVKKQNSSLPQRPIVRTVVMKNGKCIPKEEIDLLSRLNTTIIASNIAIIR